MTVQQRRSSRRRCLLLPPPPPPTNHTITCFLGPFPSSTTPASLKTSTRPHHPRDTFESVSDFLSLPLFAPSRSGPRGYYCSQDHKKRGVKFFNPALLSTSPDFFFPSEKGQETANNKKHIASPSLQHRQDGQVSFHSWPSEAPAACFDDRPRPRSTPPTPGPC